MKKPETNLNILLQNMNPILNEGDYVFCTLLSLEKIDLTKVIGSFKEKEGITLIITKEYADLMGFSYTSIMTWISLEVHSSLEAVGLTAAFSKVLADAHISCNVVAGYYHDHIFVLKQDAQRAIDLLKSIQS
jgi:hypothetical protein